MFLTRKRFNKTMVLVAECLKSIRRVLQKDGLDIDSLKDEIRYIRKYQQDLASRILSNEEMIDNLFSRVYALESKNKTNKKATIKTKGK